MSAPHDPSSSELVRLVAGREVATRIRDKGFIISSIVILLVIVGAVVIQVVTGSGDDESRGHRSHSRRDAHGVAR